MTTRLTVNDRRRIARSRELAACATAADLHEHLAGRGLIEPGEDREIYPFAFGVARGLLADLADLAERLDGTDDWDALEDMS